LMVILYAMKGATCVNRIVQIGPMQPNPGTSYPAHLIGQDDTFRNVFAQLAQLQKERDQYGDPVQLCQKFWSILRLIYVVDEANADRIAWGRCGLPNERNVMAYLTTIIQPSIQRLDLESTDVEHVTTPVLTIHGRHDRSAPYGGGREWAMWLPNARLVTVNNAGHAPWIEAPELVFGAIQTFLDGAWPSDAEIVKLVDPKSA
jgi:pimeloyl-ACP methyl ester carboxylesterase